MGQFVVAKFGGSSMADKVAMDRSAMIAFDHQAGLVVVSATYGTTNNLVKLAATAEKDSWDQCQELIDIIELKHQSIASELQVDEASVLAMEALFLELETLARGMFLLRECSLKAMDGLYALGERLSSLLFTWSLKAKYKAHNQDIPVKLFDVREVLLTDDHFGQATPIIEEIKKRCKAHLKACRAGEIIYVTQGFIGQTAKGATTTLGRGGSDYSAALLAEGLDAELLQIWTDVAGIATTDPRLCAQARPIQEITFREAAEMATFGAKILHPTTLTPAKRKQIPVFVGSSYEPHEKGTWIKKSTDENPLIRAVALKENQSLLIISTPKMLNSYGFMARIFNIFNNHRVSVDAITTSEISVAMTVDNITLSNQELISDLNQCGKVKIEKGLSLISLIGNNINHSRGLGKRIFEGLGDIDVRMICQGASFHNFCLLVQSNQGKKVVERLHRAFLE